MRSSILAFLLFEGFVTAQNTWKVGQTVKTTSGTINGQASSWKKDVSEYLGVPFALPPVGDLRWAAPMHIKDSSKTVNATKYAYSCAESASRLSKKNATSPQNIGAAENEMNEDCLYLNIWSKPQTGDKKKAVMIWIYGGGFVVGSAANSVYNGALLADEEDVIVVTVNYRLSVLGFPGVPLPERNLGLLDQRVAVEWLRDNIEKFGGDPRRMIMFGQSAGGASVDFYAYSYTKDPIISGIIPQSGTASLSARSGNGTLSATPSVAAVNEWSNLSKKLGCDSVTSDNISKSLSCMRSKPASAVLDATEPRSTGAAQGTWSVKIDDKTVFSDTAARGAKGNFIKIPILVGNTNNEGASSGAKLGGTGNAIFNCPSGKAAKLRRAQNVPAWRYLYSAEFPNQSLGPCCPNTEGAWHGSEIALIFGTTGQNGKGPDTKNEQSLAKVMRKAWTGFAKDPVKGLDKLGWPQYDDTKSTVVVLGGKDSAEVKFESASKYDLGCEALAAGAAANSSS